MTSEVRRSPDNTQGCSADLQPSAGHNRREHLTWITFSYPICDDMQRSVHYLREDSARPRRCCIDGKPRRGPRRQREVFEDVNYVEVLVHRRTRSHFQRIRQCIGRVYPTTWE